MDDRKGCLLKNMTLTHWIDGGLAILEVIARSGYICNVIPLDTFLGIPSGFKLVGTLGLVCASVAI